MYKEAIELKTNICKQIDGQYDFILYIYRNSMTPAKENMAFHS